MTDTFARLLASIVLDDWPVPAAIRRRIEAIPAVARRLGEDRDIESRLREDAAAYGGDPNGAHVAVSPLKKSPSLKTSQTRLAVFAAMATCALVLISALIWKGYPQGVERERIVERPPVEAIDVRPVIASLAAGQKIANNLSDGFRDLGTELARAGGRLGEQFSITWPQIPTEEPGMVPVNETKEN